MAEQPLDIRLRPRNLSSAGLAPTTDLDALKALWEDPARKRVWLFSGPPGCGKTTMARVLSNEIRAEFQAECDDEEQEIMLREINCSDHTGVDFSRSLVDESQLRTPRPIVYVLDECHQLTKAAQNALLKMLEEPPANRYYFLCSSEPTKLVKAIERRTKHIQFRPLTKGEAVQWTNRVSRHLGAELLGLENIEKLWRMAEGAPRNILQGLQHFYTTGKIMAPERIVGDLDIRELARSLMKGEKFSVGPARMIKEASFDPESARAGLCGYFTAVLLGSDGGEKMRKALEAVRALTGSIPAGASAKGEFVVKVADAWRAYKGSK